MATKSKVITITGPMFAGKTTKLLYYYNKYNPLETLVFNHSFDNRYDNENDNRYDNENSIISTHNKEKLQCIKVKSAYDIKMFCWDKLDKEGMLIKNIIIDECQFFKDIYQIILELQETLPNLENIICAGLDLDAKGQIFNHSFNNLINNSDLVYTLLAKCYICNTSAQYSICLVENNLSDDNILVGSSETYQPVCKEHFII
jgi:thymidine kinase